MKRLGCRGYQTRVIGQSEVAIRREVDGTATIDLDFSPLTPSNPMEIARQTLASEPFQLGHSPMFAHEITTSQCRID
jgi:hypothetical protein